jgi:hypothetical protein
MVDTAGRSNTEEHQSETYQYLIKWNVKRKTTIGLKEEALENSVTGWNARDHCRTRAGFLLAARMLWL